MAMVRCISDGQEAELSMVGDAMVATGLEPLGPLRETLRRFKCQALHGNPVRRSGFVAKGARKRTLGYQLLNLGLK